LVALVLVPVLDLDLEKLTILFGGGTQDFGQTSLGALLDRQVSLFTTEICTQPLKLKVSVL
jgi:hypothetical protein